MNAAATWLEDNVANGNLPTDWDWSNNHALFETGEVPFIMAGPWASDRIRESGVPFAVAKFPSGEGSPFAGVQPILINAQSENILLAQAFLTEYIAPPEEVVRSRTTPLGSNPVLEKVPILICLLLASLVPMPQPCPPFPPWARSGAAGTMRSFCP